MCTKQVIAWNCKWKQLVWAMNLLFWVEFGLRPPMKLL